MNEYVAQPMSDWCIWIFGLSFISTAIFLLAFAQFTMRRIEKQIKKDDVLHYKPLDFGGSRVVTYAYVIVFSERIALRMDRLLDVPVIRSYAAKSDWWLGLFFLLTSHIWIIFMLSCSAFGFI